MYNSGCIIIVIFITIITISLEYLFTLIYQKFQNEPTSSTSTGKLNIKIKYKNFTHRLPPDLPRLRSI